jgi:cytochrome c-type biogenesis protein CcmH
MRGIARLAAIGLVLAGIGTALADPKDPTLDKPLPDPAEEAHARAFMREIRCVVCQSQSIDESDAEIAAQLRNVVREQMAAGKSDAEIRDYLVARYGDFVLMKPPLKSSTVLLWGGPFALAAIGLLGTAVVLRRHRAGTAAPASTPATTPATTGALSEAERRRLRELLGEGGASNAGSGSA